MSAKVIIFLVLILGIMNPLEARQEVVTGASLVVPSKAAGAAEIPLAYDLDNGAFVFRGKSPTCNVNYEPDGLNFVFTVPKEPNYEPKGLKERDANIFFGDDRVEIYLKATDDTEPYIHLAVNAVGTLSDEKIHDRTWNSTATYAVRMERDCWRLQIKIPFSDIGFDPAKATTLKALVAVYSGEPGNSFYVASVIGTADFAFSPFQTLVLSPTLPFVEKVHIGEVAYDSKGHGSLVVDYQVKNPTARRFTIETARKRIELPGRTARPISETILLGGEKISKINLSIKDIFNVPVEVKNDILPRVDLVALDWYTSSIKVYNEKSLAPHVKDVVVLVDKRKALQCPLAKLSSSRLNVRDLKPGPHEMTCVFLNNSGTEFTRQTKTFNVLEPNPVAYDISQLDASRYYKPVTFESGTVSFTRSRFDLSKGIFPNQIEVDSRGILGPTHPFSL